MGRLGRLGKAGKSKGIKIPKAITNPSGILGELTNLFYANSYVPNKLVAYCSAVTALSMIMGGRYRTPDNVKPGLYISIVGKTGIGKNSAYSNLDSLFEQLISYGANKDRTPSSLGMG